MSSQSSPLQVDPSRRQLLGALATGALGVGAVGSFGLTGPALSQELAPTPECRDQPTEPQIEGPFYTPRSPERADLLERDAKARVIELSGFVLTRSCQPVPRVLVDLWHADDRGDYDDRGYRYRGHLITDAKGHFRFRTNVPGLYPGRTRHFHVKVLTVGRQLLTTQLYFPNEPGNTRDEFFRPALLMRTADAGSDLAARFDIVLNLR